MRAGGAVGAQSVSIPSPDARVDGECVARRLAGQWEGATLRGPVAVVRLEAAFVIHCAVSYDSLHAGPEPLAGREGGGSGGGGPGEGTIGLDTRSGSCVASDVALQALLAHQECRIAKEEVQAADAPGQTLVLEAKPAGQLRSGKDARIAVMLRNRSRAPVPLYYEESCSFEPVPIGTAFGLEVVGRRGPVEVLRGMVEARFAKDTSRCERPVFRFILPPGRGVSAIIPFGLATAPPGPYTFRVTFSSTADRKIVGAFKARVQ
jgi:hypothetical protein